MLGNIVFLEIIELNFCGLSDNIRRNIKLKGELDLKELFKDPKPVNIIEENKKEEENKEIEVYE